MEKDYNKLIKWIEEISSRIDINSLFSVILEAGRSLTNSEASSLLLLDEIFREIVFIQATGKVKEKVKGVRFPMEKRSIAGWVVKNKKVLLVSDTRKDRRFYKTIDEITGFSTRSILAVPLKSEGKVVGVMEIINKKTGNFTERDIEIAGKLAVFAGREIKNLEKIQHLKEEVSFLRKEIEEPYHPVWKSKGFNNVVEMAHQVAFSNSIVLIEGESGVGKEVIAREIHRHSPRREKPFIPVNCASIPEHLLESELFGYEKGAFTGAMKTKKGIVEMASMGTLFIDEIGDIPMNTQVKILRFLDDRSFQRLGGDEIKKVDVRIICASNQNLKKLVSEKTFREDLYYRISVFPLYIPPLRDRKEDIIVLANYFLEKSVKDIKKSVKGFTEKAKERLLSYNWPGNARELKNIVERALILTNKNVLDADVIDIASIKEERGKITLQKALQKFKKEYISDILSKTDNQKEAAKILGIQSTYLSRLVKELDIKQP